MSVDLKTAVGAWMRDGKLSADPASFGFTEKLNIFQRTPEEFKKHRPTGRESIPYVEYSYAKAALLFIFNFQVSTEIKKIEFAHLGKSKNNVDMYGAWVHVQFIFRDGDRVMTHDVISTGQGYKNPATSQFDVIKVAVSKAWTVAARIFGIGDDLNDVFTVEKEDYVPAPPTRPQYAAQAPKFQPPAPQAARPAVELPY